jgi:hypothetical protein
MTFSTALSLADEYGIKLWIAALLDPEPITHGTNDPKKSIQSPPTFSMKDPINGLGRSPEKPDGRRSTRGTRSLRSASPMKKDLQTPSRRIIATPRKGRKSKKPPQSQRRPPSRSTASLPPLLNATQPRM